MRPSIGERPTGTGHGRSPHTPTHDRGHALENSKTMPTAQPVIHLLGWRRARAHPRSVRERDDVLADDPPIDIDQPDPVPIIQLRKALPPTRTSLRIRPRRSTPTTRGTRSPRSPTPGPVTTNESPTGSPHPDHTNANAPATPTNLILAADAQATYPVGRITRQAQDQVSPLPPPRSRRRSRRRSTSSRARTSRCDPMLDALAGEIGCTVHERALPAARTAAMSPTRPDHDDSELSANARVKTRCHELAHALIRRERQDGDPSLTTPGRAVVESIAYTCVGALGIRSDGTRSVPRVLAEASDLACSSKPPG